MERRTFLGTCAAFLGLPFVGRRAEAGLDLSKTEDMTAITYRPIRQKPYIEEGRPEYEEPPEWTIDNETFRIIIGDDGYSYLVGPRQDQEWARLGLQNAVTRIKGPVGRNLQEGRV